ncbi:MAG: hypothetical protein A2176_08915 [Spirochaetes bacterium RBG_13_51_14]|nr:MAG: hypothetical protein A2176_08915 [Spirochaetes bacterium RBG_13_51_14]
MKPLSGNPGEGVMSKKKCMQLLLPPLCALLISPRPDASGTITFPLVPEPCLSNVKIIAGASGEKLYTLEDLTYKNASDPFITDIVLSFNAPSTELRRDDTKHYRITRSDYTFTRGNGSLGNGCAKFFKKEDGVVVETVKNAWLGTCKDLGSFTIELRFFPYELRDGSVLFSRVGYFSGSKRGIEITLQNGRVIAALFGIFDKPTMKKYDIVLRRGRPLSKMKWYHVSLSFDRISGKLAKYLDGEEEEVLLVTESGDAFNGVYAPSFGYRNAGGRLICLDSPAAILGKDFSGLLDEFRISYRHFEDLEKRTELAYRNYHAVGRIGRIPFNVEGVITSPVYRFPETGTKVMEFRWREELPRDTFIWMQFRISDRSFAENDTDIRWYRVANNQKKIYLIKNHDGDYLRGRNYQWRAHLVSSPDGKSAPRLHGIGLDYQLDLPPNPPQLLEVAAAGDRLITLKWKKNVDHDIAGYKIYYGTSPGRYDGILTSINGARISNGINTGDHIQVIISNSVIEENKSLDARVKLSFPFIQNTVLYYISVSAYDSYKPDTPYNHESELSQPVNARPYAGSEIK